MLNNVAQISVYFVCAFPCASVATLKRDCNDCVVYNLCDTAVTLLRKRDPAADARLKSVFCGFDYNKLPMVCCSELTTGQAPAAIEYHPNLRLFPENCSHNKKKISGSRPAERYEFPWMVLLAYETPLGPQFKCGGSLISERYVLTAAHCLSDLKLIGVRVGELDVDATTACAELGDCIDQIQDLRVEEAIPHAEYRGRPNVRNDIGLLRLRKPVDLSQMSRSQQSFDLGRQVATLAGWGSTEHGSKSSILRTAAVPVYTVENCRKLYNRGKKPNEEDETTNKLCAGQKGIGSCEGDSGGPLMLREEGRFVQYGVDSYGPTLCGADFPTAYTDVTKYVKWILDTIRP
ncbi:CLIP domain-containing serine protease HP8-like isoform X2 [Leguminivora glycinivorella]|uniref:CLIP domain-containing serine protease HP8-like isoform X2 n=1 Tax=Leguminivora glycinivorella TaxID=1035111 RepID=UPI00200F8B4B|nr:CLIP domain-containing serine protease HP8-like isoform X2 [Leguminivora glycinivorella]